AVLMEAMLQPCGWIMFYLKPGGVLGGHARNLGGTLTVHEEVPPGSATLRARTEILSTSELGAIWLCTLAVRSFVGSRCVSEMRTSFGLFPPEALREQAGVPSSAD